MKTARNNLLSVQLMKIVNLLRKNELVNGESAAFIVSSFQQGNFIPLKNLIAVVPDSYVTVKKELKDLIRQVE